MTFKQWLSRQRRREDPIGDLARDAQGDRRLPNDPERIESYLISRGACEEALSALKDGLAEWKQWPSAGTPEERISDAIDHIYRRTKKSLRWRQVAHLLRTAYEYACAIEMS